MTDGLTLIATLHRAAQIAGASFADAMGSDDITARQMQVLAAIAGTERPHQTRVCELTGIDRSTLSIVCRRLAQKGWVTRLHARCDARAYAMTLTPKGRAVLACAMAAADRAAPNIRASIVGADQLRIIERAHDTPERPEDTPERAQHAPAGAGLAEGAGARHITPRQMEVLAAIAASEGLSQRNLCDMMGVDCSMISLICKRLANNGWITRRRAPADARSYILTVTSQGNAVLASCRAAADLAVVANSQQCAG